MAKKANRTKLPWSKWYWADWMTDTGLRACSYAAKGLWMDMLSLMATSREGDSLVIEGKPMEVEALARATGGTPEEVTRLLSELERYGVFSRMRNGVIYCRKMHANVSRSDKNRRNARARWGVASDGNKKEKQGSHGVSHANRTQKTMPRVQSQSQSQSLDSDSPLPPQGASVRVAFEKFWKAYPKRDGPNPKAPAENKFADLCRSGADPDSIVAGANAYANECKRKATIGTQYVAQAVTWLNQRRWQDYTGPPSGQSAVDPEHVARVLASVAAENQRRAELKKQRTEGNANGQAQNGQAGQSTAHGGPESRADHQGELPIAGPEVQPGTRR